MKVEFQISNTKMNTAEEYFIQSVSPILGKT